MERLLNNNVPQTCHYTWYFAAFSNLYNYFCRISVFIITFSLMINQLNLTNNWSQGRNPKENLMDVSPSIKSSWRLKTALQIETFERLNPTIPETDPQLIHENYKSLSWKCVDGWLLQRIWTGPHFLASSSLSIFKVLHQLFTRLKETYLDVKFCNSFLLSRVPKQTNCLLFLNQVWICWGNNCDRLWGKVIHSAV